MIRETAPAKINLYLHVGPLRSDGLHDIASLFVFAEDGDVVEAEPAETLSLEIGGAFAPALSAFPVESNLVQKAAQALQREYAVAQGARLRLDKRLPVAAGVGGGSADAAAALRALTRLWKIDAPEAALRNLAFHLGADVPACLAGAPVFVDGAGEALREGPRLPPLWICLVNPGVETPTGPVFKAFDAANPAPPAPAHPFLTDFASLNALQEMMSRTRNDLELSAIRREPVIAAARDLLSSCAGNLAARMSGSGATVFGVFSSSESAEAAAQRAAAAGWWSMASKLASGRGQKEDRGGENQ